MNAVRIISLAVITFCGGFTTFAQTWTQTSAANTNWFSIASSADGSILFAAGGTTNHEQIYVSTNYGASWVPTALPMTNSLYSVAMSADASKVFVARDVYASRYTIATNPAPFWISTNLGASWQTIMGPSTNNTPQLVVSADGRTLFGIMGDYQSFPLHPYRWHLLISTNSGNTWSSGSTSGAWVGQLISSADGSRLSVISVSGNQYQKLLTTTNYGSTWNTIIFPNNHNFTITWETLACSADGKTLVLDGYDGSDFSYWFIGTSTNAGATWITNYVSGASSAQLAQGYGFVTASSADGSRLFASAFGVICISTNFGNTWAQMPAPSTNWSKIASSADGTKLAAAVAGNFYVPNAGGGIWTSQITPSPIVNLSPTNNNLALSWLIPSTNFILQQNSDLTTTNWSAVTNAPVLNLTNLQNQVTLPAPASNAFFRLKTP